MIENKNLVLLIFVVGAYVLSRAFYRLRQVRLAKDTERSVTSAAPQGGVELEGYVWPASPPLRTLHGRLSVFRTVRIEKRARRKDGTQTNWVPLLKDEQALPFYLIDKGGAALILTRNSFFKWHQKNSKTIMWSDLTEEQRAWISAEVVKGKIPDVEKEPENIRCVEASLHVGQPLYARGLFKGKHPEPVNDHALQKFHGALFGNNEIDFDSSTTTDAAKYTTELADAAIKNEIMLPNLPVVSSHGVLEATSDNHHYIADLKQEAVILNLGLWTTWNFVFGSACLALAVTSSFLNFMKQNHHRVVGDVVHLSSSTQKQLPVSESKVVDKESDVATKIVAEVVTFGSKVFVIEAPQMQVILSLNSLESKGLGRKGLEIIANKYLLHTYTDGWGDGDKFDSVDLWDLDKRRVVSRWFPQNLRSAIPVGLEAERIAALVGDKDKYQFKIWNRESRKIEFEREFSKIAEDTLQRSPAGQLIAFAASEPGQRQLAWYVWDQGLQTLEPISSSEPHSSKARIFKLGDAKTPNEISLREAVVSSTGRFAVGLMNDVDDLFLVDLVTGERREICSYYCTKAADLNAASLSPNGRWLYLPTKSLLWDTRTAKAIQVTADAETYRLYNPGRIWEKKTEPIDPELCLTISAKCWYQAPRVLLDGQTDYGYALMRGACRAGKREACALSNEPNPREGDDQQTASTKYKREDFHTLRDYIEFLRSPYSSNPPVKSKKAN